MTRGAPEPPGLAARLANGEQLVTRTLTDGGQTPLAIAAEVAAFLDGARRSLDLALYDIRIASPVAEVVRDAVTGAAARGVQVRIAYNTDHDRPIPVPPPPRTQPSLIESLGVPHRGIPGVPDLMHHKYVVRDGASVWSGSTNWTDDAWSRQENVIVALESPGVAAAYAHNFDELWRRRSVADSGDVDAVPMPVGGATARAWFCPGRGTSLSHRIARAIARAQRRVRIASPVITAAPIIATLAQVASDRSVDITGVVDATQVAQVLQQWRENGNAPWKTPALRAALERGGFTGKRSTPYAEGSVHDYMHAKVTVADDTTFVGSFNLSRSGELNAENVLEILDPGLADAMAAFVDGVRARYPAVAVVDGIR